MNQLRHIFRASVFNVVLICFFVAIQTFVGFGQVTIHSQNFENAGAIPTGWSQINKNLTNNFTFITGAGAGSINSANGGTYNASMFATRNSITKLVTPVLDFSGNTTNPTLKFWHGQEFWSPDQDELRVYYSTASATGPWTLVGGAVWTSNVATWTQRTVTLPSVNSTYYIAFEGTSNYGYGIVIDDVLITGDPSNDANSTLAAGVLSEPATIITTADTPGEAVNVFDFKFTDLGTSDGVATKIDIIDIRQGIGNTEANWANIAGAYLNGPGLTNEVGTITGTKIVFNPAALVSVADGGNATYTLSVWLGAGVTAGNDLAFKLASATEITTDASGSSFASSTLESGAINIINCVSPVQIATGLSVAYASSTSVNLTYTAPADGDELIVVCRPSGTSAVAPSYGNTYNSYSLDYSLAEVLSGTNKVVFSGLKTAATKTITGLDCATDYIFDIYTRQSSGNCYNNTEATVTYNTKRLCTDTYTQASTAVTTQSATDVELYRIDIVSGGSTGNLRLNSIQFTSNNDADADVIAANCKLYWSTNTSFPTGTTLLATATLTGGAVAFSLGTPYDFTAGTTYLWLAVDVSASAILSDVLDFSVQANDMNIEAVTYPSSAQNPTGTRTITNGNTNGFKIAGNIVNTGTWAQYASDGVSAPTEYIRVSSSGALSGNAGTFTNLWLEISGDLSFDCTNMNGEIARTVIASGNNVTVTNSANTILKTSEFKNNGTMNLAGSNSKMEVSGNFINSGTLQANAGSTVEFLGSSAVTVTANYNKTTTANSFATVIFNNQNITPIALGSNFGVSESATFSDGIITSSSSEMPVFEDNATVAGATDASHVSGPVRKVGNDVFTFPIGVGGKLQELGISSIASATQAYEAQAFSGTPPEKLDVIAPISNVSDNSYYDIYQDATTGIDDAVIELFWYNATAEGIANCTDLTIAHYVDQGAGDFKWQEEAATTTGGSLCTAANSGSVKMDAEMATYSRVIFASRNGTNPLPIELVSFTAKKEGKANTIKWITATEQNSDFFEIQRSSNGEDFKTIGILEAAGSSTETLTYSFNDYKYSKISYYRLKSVDFDGSTEYSQQEILIRKNETDFNNSIAVFPNPTNDIINISFSIKEAQWVKIELVDIAGRIVKSKSAYVSTNSIDNMNLSGYANGSYLLRISTERGSVFNQNIIKN